MHLMHSMKTEVAFISVEYKSFKSFFFYHSNLTQCTQGSIKLKIMTMDFILLFIYFKLPVFLQKST